MKKIFVLLILTSLFTTSCKDKDPVITQPVIVENTPENKPVEKEVKASPKDSEADDMSDQSSATTLDTGDAIKFSCEDNICPDNLGHVVLGDGNVCQGYRFQKSFIVSTSCLEDSSLEKQCQDMKVYQGDETFKCISLKGYDGKFYEVKTGYGESFELENIFTAPEEVNEVSQLTSEKSQNSVLTKDSKCSVDFGSVHHLDTFDYDSSHFYSRDCDEDFIFINHMLAGVKVLVDDYGVKYFNLKCLNSECREDVSKKDKVVSTFFNSEKISNKKEGYSVRQDGSYSVLDVPSFTINQEEIRISRKTHCLKFPVDEYRELVLSYIYIIHENGKIVINFDKKMLSHKYYYVSYYYSVDPIIKTNRAYLPPIDDTIVFDVNNGNSSGVSPMRNYKNYKDLLSKFQAYGPYDRRIPVSRFNTWAENNTVDKDKKLIVPRCSSLIL